MRPALFALVVLLGVPLLPTREPGPRVPGNTEPAAYRSSSAPTSPPPVSVMIVGDFHMSNPGKDLHNVTSDDMLSPKRQAEMSRVTQALARFRPTLVAVEWPADVAAQRYDAYLKGTLPPSRNEVVQLGFRLAQMSGLKQVHGIDVPGTFPYDAVAAFAAAHGQSEALVAVDAENAPALKQEETLLKSGTVTDVLRYLNDPRQIEGSNYFYRMMLHFGDDKEQPGADLLTAWYRRNFLICANLVQLAKPGDRVVVLYGSGHAFLLRQCAKEMPGYLLVDANGYLPH